MPARTLEALAFNKLLKIHSAEESDRQRHDSVMTSKLESRDVTVDKSGFVEANYLSGQPLSTSNDDCGVDTETSDEAISIKTLVSAITPPAHAEWMKENGIEHIQIPILPNKEGKPSTPVVNFNSALAVILRRSSHPILIHCNQGRHRTGCVVACFRRVIGEDLIAAISEYHTYADPKARPPDEVWIRNYDATALARVAAHEHWIGSPQQPTARTLTPVASRTGAPKVRA
ncbi:MAG: hypothetical protein Q9157_001949 [Trypethelium eluteriae]